MELVKIVKRKKEGCEKQLDELKTRVSPKVVNILTNYAAKQKSDHKPGFQQEKEPDSRYNRESNYKRKERGRSIMSHFTTTTSFYFYPQVGT